MLDLLRAGHAVTTFNRGVSADDLPANVSRLRGDRDAGLAGLGQLSEGWWDACIDVSGYTAAHLHASVAILKNRVAHYVFVSAVSVYATPVQGAITEDSTLVLAAPENTAEVVGDMYGRLKVTCESIVNTAFAGCATILRPQVIVGPNDPTARFTYWLNRALRPGPMLTPGDGHDFLQVVDIRDVAAFARLVIEGSRIGTFNLSGERVVWRQFVDLLGPTEVVWVPSTILQAASLGFTDLPLYRPQGSARAALMHVNSERALGAGFSVTPLLSTVARIKEWMVTGRSQGQEGLRAETERLLIQRALAQSAATGGP